MTFRRNALLMVLAAACCLASGCAVYEPNCNMPTEQRARVVLKENDFEVVQRNLEGEHSCWTLWLGLYRIGLPIPLGDPRLYSCAMQNLRNSPNRPLVAGRSQQFVNCAWDTNALVIPIPGLQFVKETAKFRADLIQYTK